MKFEIIKRSLIAAACSALAAGLLAPTPAAAQEAAPELDADLRAHAGRALAYQQLERTSLETVTTPERLLRVAQGGYAPTEIWRALEHGEKVECLNCIPAVSKLLFSDEAKTREISAWWLRRRIFGVFGPGEVSARHSSMASALAFLAWAASSVASFFAVCETHLP